MRSFLVISSAAWIAVASAQNLFNFPDVTPDLVDACFTGANSSASCQGAQSALFKCYNSLDIGDFNVTRSCLCADGPANYLSTSEQCLSCYLNHTDNSGEDSIFSLYTSGISELCSATAIPNEASLLSQYLTNFGISGGLGPMTDASSSVSTTISGSSASTTGSGSSAASTTGSSTGSSTATSTAMTTTKSGAAPAVTAETSSKSTNAAMPQNTALGLPLLGAVAGAAIALL